MQTLKSGGSGICRQYGRQSCRLFGAIKHSRRSSGFAASRSPAHVATVVKLQWHLSWNTGCFSTGKCWRKRETGVCKKRRTETADGPWHSCEICCKHPVNNLSPKLQVPCKQKSSFAEVAAQWAFSGYGQSPFTAGTFNVSDSPCLSSLDLSPQPWKEPMQQMEVFIIMSLMSGEKWYNQKNWISLASVLF